MKKKQVIDLITSIALMVLASLVMLLPLLNTSDLKIILYIIFGFYSIFKLSQFILIFKEKDYESFLTFIVSLGALISFYIVDLSVKNLVLILLIWMGLMCLIKLKKADFYHDKNNKMWILRLFIVFAFLASGLLMSINLMYDKTGGIIIIGYFFFINSLLDAIDPLVLYLLGNKVEN